MQSSQITMSSATRTRPKNTPLSLTAAIAIASAFTLFSFSTTVAAQPLRRPNILLILADDLGFGDLGCYGQKEIATPQLDRMAQQGMRFTQFYAGATVCAPSRSVLMTGKHHGHTRVRGNAGAQNPAAQALQAGDVTLARVLKQAGYRTALIGK
jgi:arylsulfatase A-like enzyme